MITTTFLNIIYVLVYAVTLVIRVLPDVSASSTVVAAVSTATSYLAVLNNFLPMSTIFLVLTAIIVVELAIATYKLIMWLIRRFPTQS